MTEPTAEDISRESPSGALARGLRVLAAVNDLETATVSRIVSDSGMPKATVIRLLQTLQAEGYIAQDAETLTYAVTPKVASLSRAFKGNDEIEGFTQVALDLLAEQIKWPAEYLVQDGLSMLIQSNNRARAPIKLKLFERSRFPILGSAAGIAYLSTLPAEDCERILDRAASDPGERSAARSRIAEARKAGFAVRGLLELGPNMAVVAVPVPDRGGALSVVHFDDVVTPQQMQETILPRMHACAENVAKALRGIYPG